MDETLVTFLAVLSHFFLKCLEQGKHSKPCTSLSCSPDILRPDSEVKKKKGDGVEILPYINDGETTRK